MEKSNGTTFIVVVGILILCVFIGVITFNLMPNNEKSSSYYVKVNDNINAKIENIYVEDNELTIITSGDAVEYCVKTTKSNPSDNAICWKKIEGNITSTSVYKYKKYYVWIKDNEGNISSPISINS